MDEFERCLKAGRLIRESAEMEWVEREVEEAGYDLKWSSSSLKDGNFKWATVQGYYAMFHAAKALVLLAGYREQSHRCLVVAIRHLYVETGALPLDEAERLEEAMELRMEADYAHEYSEEVARTVVRNARRFLGHTRKIVESTTTARMA